MAAEHPEARQHWRFLLLYALAVAGGAVAYVPFLTILLPMRVSAMTGAKDISSLAMATFAGAIAASLGNMAFGWASDRTRSRGPWIAAGLVLSTLLLACFGVVQSLAGLIALLLAWQLALNMMLGPLAAWGGDFVPDGQKGILGGLLAFAPAAGALSGVIVTLPGLASSDQRLWLVCAMVVACVTPALLFGQPREFPELMRMERPDEATPRTSTPFASMWVARLLVQVSEAALFAFLYFWFRSVDPRMTDYRVAQVFGVILACAVPVALLAGQWADRSGKPFRTLAVAAGVATGGLVLMAAASGLLAAIAGYVVFGLGAAVFLSLHSAQTLRVLPKPGTRGRDLGVFNLTNTCPSLVMPVLTLALVPQFGFTGLFVALAGCALLAALLLARLTPQF